MHALGHFTHESKGHGRVRVRELDCYPKVVPNI